MRKYAMYSAVAAIVSAINENEDGVKKAMNNLWENLFPEERAKNDMRAEEMNKIMEEMPSVLYVKPKFNETQDLQPSHDDGKISIRPGINFDGIDDG